jgi:hypothetical protein
MTKDRYFLSFAQQRMRMLHLFEPDEHAYVMCSASHVQGALESTLGKHAVVRDTVVTTRGKTGTDRNSFLSA